MAFAITTLYSHFFDPDKNIERKKSEKNASNDEWKGLSRFFGVNSN